MKKILSFLLAIMLLSALAAPVFAGAEAPAPRASITFNNGLADENYVAYQLLRLYSYDFDTGATSYRLPENATWRSFIQSKTNIFDFYDPDYVNFNSELSDSEMQALADEAYTYAVPTYNSTKKVTVAAGQTSVTMTDLEPGAYLIVSSLGTIRFIYNTINTTDRSYDITINEKNVQPTLEKLVCDPADGVYRSSASYTIGDDVLFRLYINIPQNDTDGVSRVGAKNIVVDDLLSDAFDFTISKNNFTVSFEKKDGETYTAYAIGGEPLTSVSDYYAQEGTEFTLNFSQIWLNEIPADGGRIVVDYTAKLNQNAVIGDDGNENLAVLHFATQLGEGDVALDIENGYPESLVAGATVYTHRAEILKYDGTPDADGAVNKAPLPGAVFELLKDGQVVNLVPVADSNNLHFRLPYGDETGEADFTTNGGIVYIDGFGLFGLEETDYELHEKQAPRGYNALTGNTPVAAQIVPTADGSSSAMQWETIEIANFTGTVLPSTGGIGTTIFYVVGGVLIVGAAVVLVTRSRVNKQEAADELDDADEDDED